MSDKPTICKAIPLPCYPPTLEAAVKELELTWATEHGDRRHNTIYEAGFADLKGGGRGVHLIITMREL